MIGYLPKWTHMGIFGTTGVGKSTLAELICELEHHNNKMKIIDLQNNKYLEVCSFMSPTRNMKNNTRAVRHLNPWNPQIIPHSYGGYEDEFREFMVEAGIPVEKELPVKKDDE